MLVYHLHAARRQRHRDRRPVRALLPELQAALPNDVDLQVVFDRTVTIRASLKEVEPTLLIIILVVLVTFAFLRRPRPLSPPSPCRCR